VRRAAAGGRINWAKGCKTELRDGVPDTSVPQGTLDTATILSKLAIPAMLATAGGEKRQLSVSELTEQSQIAGD
jgi:hypothetical protein